MGKIKVPNPEIEAIESCVDSVIDVKDHYGHGRWIKLDAKNFVEFATNASVIFKETYKNSIFYFFFMEGMEYCCEIRKEVKM